MSKPDLSTYGGRLRDLGYAGQIVDGNPITAVTMVNDQATAIDFGFAVARSAADNTCKAPSADADKVIGLSIRHAIRPASSDGVVTYAQKDAVPILRDGFVYVTAAENAARGDIAVALTASAGAIGSVANDPVPSGSSAVTLPATHAASGTITIVTNPAADDTVTVHGTAITFKAAGANGTTQVDIGLTAAATATALYTLLAASDNANLIKSTYADNGAGVITVTSVATNTGANALTLATSVPSKITVPATLTGGLGNVGNGVFTKDATTPVLATAQAGAYRAVCTAAAGNGGTFRVYDPVGATVDDYTVGATFSDQVKFVIADGSADFVVGDSFTLTVSVAATGRIRLDGLSNVKVVWETTTLANAIGIVRVFN